MIYLLLWANNLNPVFHAQSDENNNISFKIWFFKMFRFKSAGLIYIVSDTNLKTQKTLLLKKNWQCFLTPNTGLSMFTEN